MARVKRKIPRVGSTLWQLWQLDVGENYTLTEFMSVNDATETKIRNKRFAIRNKIANCKKAMLELGKDFTVTVYDYHDAARQRFVFHAVATIIPFESEPDDKRKIQSKKDEDYDI